MMLAHWIALDPGSNLLRLYDYSRQKEIKIKSCIALNQDKLIATGKDALGYVYSAQRTIQVKYPIKQGNINGDITPLIKAALKELKVSQNIFKPCMVVCLNEAVDMSQRQKWQQQLILSGIRKVEFVNTMELLASEEACFIIHAGHSCTEIGIYAYGQTFAHKMVYFSGSSMDEKIKTIIAQKTNCLIWDEDASALRETVSQAFYSHKNAMLQCHALDRFGKVTQIQVLSSDIWPAMEEEIKQIVLWARQCYMNMGNEMKERLMRNGIHLSGGLASCFGLKEALSQAFDCPIICTKLPECDIIEQMKGLK